VPTGDIAFGTIELAHGHDGCEHVAMWPELWMHAGTYSWEAYTTSVETSPLWTRTSQLALAQDAPS
jgi:hypothetical protein